MDNTLLRENKLPPFSQILPEHIVPAVDDILAQCREQVKQLVALHLADDATPPTWLSFIGELEGINDYLSQAWSPVSHMKSVVNSDALREAYNDCLPKLSEYSTEMGQNKDLYNLYKAYSDGDEFAGPAEADEQRPRRGGGAYRWLVEQEENAQSQRVVEP